MTIDELVDDIYAQCDMSDPDTAAAMEALLAFYRAKPPIVVMTTLASVLAGLVVRHAHSEDGVCDFADLFHEDLHERWAELYAVQGAKPKPKMH